MHDVSRIAEEPDGTHMLGKHLAVGACCHRYACQLPMPKTSSSLLDIRGHLAQMYCLMLLQMMPGSMYCMTFKYSSSTSV